MVFKPMKSISLVGFALFILCAGQSNLSFAERSNQYQKCMDSVDLGAFKNTQFSACAEKELKLIDRTLNTEYIKLRKNLSPEQKDFLTKGQRAWLQFREDWCRFEESHPSAPGGIVNYRLCLLEKTDRQISLIKGLKF